MSQSLSESLKSLASPIINQIYNDDFIQSMLDGSTPKGSIEHYLRADHQYLNEFAKIYALLVPKAHTNEEMNFLLSQIDFVINGEVDAHYFLSEYVGKSYEDIIKGHHHWYPSADHYVKHMYYQVNMREDIAYTVAAMCPCPYVYQQLALKMKEHHSLESNHPMLKWIDFYVEGMDELLEYLFNWIDQSAEMMSQDEVEDVKMNFLQSCEHERKFFNMSYQQEDWMWKNDEQ